MTQTAAAGREGEAARGAHRVVRLCEVLGVEVEVLEELIDRVHHEVRAFVFVHAEQQVDRLHVLIEVHVVEIDGEHVAVDHWRERHLEEAALSEHLREKEQD